MKRFLYIMVLCMASVAPIMAQQPSKEQPQQPVKEQPSQVRDEQQSYREGEYKRPIRTPEEEANKMTELLSRELSLTELQKDTVYRIHLKYAKLRRTSNTRQEALQRMNDMTKELLQVMTKKQQESFLNKQIDNEPRRPQSSVGRICRDSI